MENFGSSLADNVNYIPVVFLPFPKGIVVAMGMPVKLNPEFRFNLEARMGMPIVAFGAPGYDSVEITFGVSLGHCEAYQPDITNYRQHLFKRSFRHGNRQSPKEKGLGALYPFAFRWRGADLADPYALVAIVVAYQHVVRLGWSQGWFLLTFSRK